jgi:adenosylcobinamide-GDP ribazoletransferase
MNKAARGFLTSFTLVSRVPLRLSFEPDYSRSDFWIPVVGIFAALAALGGACLGQLLFRSPLFAALGAILAQYLAFNVFHLDGLLDTADAMMCVASPERRLEILKDSRIGTYAFFAGILSLGLRLACLVALDGRAAGPWPSAALVLALLAAPAAGRAGCSLVSVLVKPARERGLGALTKGNSGPWTAAGLLAALLPLAGWSLVAGAWPLGLAAAVAAIAGAGAAGLGLALLYSRKVGGYTGDALGAAVEVGELLCLLALTAFVALSGTSGGHEGLSFQLRLR